MNRRERRAKWLARHRGDAAGERVPPLPSRQATTELFNDAAPRPAAPAPASLHLHIEEVVLHGLNPRGRYRFGDALQHELARLLGERGVPPSLNDARAAEQLDAGSFQTQSDPRPQALGAQVARAIYGGLKG